MSKFAVSTSFASAEVPKFLEKKSQNIVYFGENNLYPFELIDLYNDSSTHNAIINGKVGYVVGNGLESDDLSVKKWLSSANLSEDWTSLAKRIALDYELFNGYAIEVIKTAVGNQYHHVDFANIRLGLDDSIQYSDDWITEKGARNARPDIKYLERYNPADENQKRGIIYHVDYRPNLKHYPLPVYVGSLAEIKTDVQIGDYWLNEVKSGFAGGTIITHNNGVPETLEESKAFEKSFQDKFGGASGTKIVHLFSPSKENSSEITSLNGNDLHERYVEMSKRVKESIFIGHRVTNPILFGVKEQGQLGGRSELDLAYEIFSNTYVQERKNTILRTIKKLAFLEIQNTNIELLPLKPIDTIDLTSDIILANLTRLEIRDLINEQTGLELAEEVAAVEEIAEPVTEMATIDEDREMIDGIVELLLRVDDLDNRREMAIATLRDFDEQGVIYNRKDFLNRVGISLDNEQMSACSCFSGDENISHMFNDIGVSEDDYEEIDRFEINFNEDGQPMEFATEGQGIIQKVLKALLENPLIEATGISSILGLALPTLVKSIGVLTDSKLIEVEDSAISLTPIGERVAKAIEIPTAEVKYKYELRPNAPALKKGGKSRDFCRDMISKKKLWSREEIERKRNHMEKSGFADITNVWLARGGWYSPKGKDKASLPYCRHVWTQVIVRKKK